MSSRQSRVRSTASNHVEFLPRRVTPLRAVGRRARSALAVGITLLVVVPTACGQLDSSAPPEHRDGHIERTATASAPLSRCPWDPVFGVNSCYQGSWWVEYSVKDSTAAAMEVEVSSATGSSVIALSSRTVLWGGYVKFSGGPYSAPVETGTLIRLHATQSTAGGGKTAESGWFAYRNATPVVACGACTPSCPADTCGSDGCGGTCTCATGSVCMASLKCCRPNSNACGPDGCGGSHGACACAPNCTGKLCGDDGCGGSCGSCALGTTCTGGACVGGCVSSWSPFWKQTEYAGSWWAEFQLAGGGSLPRSVSLEVLGRGSFNLSLAYGKWASGLDGVPPGTSVILHATDATGATAQTVPFRYLVDMDPVTDLCKGTSSKSSLCQPLTRGMVTFTMDDSLESQSVLARPILAKYGHKATIYHISNQLDAYGLLPSAGALATDGHEVGSHSRMHPFLTSVTPTVLDDELRLSRQYLRDNVGSPVVSFASPMGDYNATVIAAIKKHYASHRTVNPGLNYVGSDVYELNADSVYNSSTVSSMCAQLTETALNRAWRILVFHEFTTAATTDSLLGYPIADFEGILKCAQSTLGLDVVTTRQGVAAIACASP